MPANPDNDPRLNKAREWLKSLGENQPRLQAVAGDASARRYFRLSGPHPSRLLMDSPPQSEPLAPFLEVTRILQAAGLPAPDVLAINAEEGFLLLQDFGDHQLRDALSERTVGHWWPCVFDLLTRMAAEADATTLPDYSSAMLQRELDLFPDWYLDRHIGQSLSPRQMAVWTSLCEQLIESATGQPQVFVHRDFHSCNLMVTGDCSLGLIDYQDAVYGPVSYDLMSILLDRYISWPRDLLEGWLQIMRRQLAPEIPGSEWIRLCDWMGLQRNLKIIGIFARLNHRDGKGQYLELIPRFAGYVLDTTGRYPEFSDAHELLGNVLTSQPEDITCTP